MRSTTPIPGEPWPHDMVIRVEDNPLMLIELLWVREAWRLEPAGDDLPPRLTNTPQPTGGSSDDGRDVSGWEQAWPSIWRAALDHLGRTDASAIIEDLQRTADGSAERLELIRRLHGPSWRDEFGDAAFDASYREWSASGLGARTRRGRTFDEIPERVSLDALIPAWQAGLTQVVTIPCVGEFTRVIGPNSLLVTVETRSDPQRYASALTSFSTASG